MAHLFPWSLELGDGKDPFPFQVAIHFNMKFDRSLYGKFWWWCSPVWASTQFLGIFVFVWNFETAVASCSKIRQNNMNSRFRHVAEAFSNRYSDLRWFEAWEHFAESWLVLECDFDPWKRSWKVTETRSCCWVIDRTINVPTLDAWKPLTKQACMMDSSCGTHLGALQTAWQNFCQKNCRSQRDSHGIVNSFHILSCYC